MKQINLNRSAGERQIMPLSKKDVKSIENTLNRSLDGEVLIINSVPILDLTIRKYDLIVITALEEALNILNPKDIEELPEGYSWVVKIKDNNTPRALTFDTKYRAIGITLPTTTTANKILYLAFSWSKVDQMVDVVGVKEEA